MNKTKLEELKLLDLQKAHTVGEIVDAMRFCSFGARNLGEVAHSIAEIKRKGEELYVFCDDFSKRDPFLDWLHFWTDAGFCKKMIVMNGYAFRRDKFPKDANFLFLGNFARPIKKQFYQLQGRNIFINSERWHHPGQCRDGYFPDVVFADPRFAVPIISMYLREKFMNMKTPVNDLFLAELTRCGGLASEVVDGAETLSQMVNDPQCAVLMTMSGAMTIAQLGLVICDLIDNKMIRSLTTTGAAMAHGLVESMGLKHYKYDPAVSDVELARRELNRVTDTLELESNFDHIDEIVAEVLNEYAEQIDKGKIDNGPFSYSNLYALIGCKIHEIFPHDRGILKSAMAMDVPVFTPAFVDSEIYNDIFTFNYRRKISGLPPVLFNEAVDNEKLIELVQKNKRVGIFSIGGGVPRNWTQNVAPLIELINSRIKGKKLRVNPFFYGVRICPDHMDLGHLSGCTYSEGMSWRKMNPKGRFAEVHADATMILPFVVKYAMNKLHAKSK